MVVLDNLSTLASGMKENDAFEWEQVNNWLLHFRRHKIAVILVPTPVATAKPEAQVSVKTQRFG